MDSEESWQSLVSPMPQDELSVYGGKFWKRTRRLLVKLAARSDQLPPSLELAGVEATHASVRCGGFSDIYEGMYQGNKVALKRLRVFSSSPTAQNRRSREVSVVVTLTIRSNSIREETDAL